MAVVNQFNTKIRGRLRKEFWGESAVGFDEIFAVNKKRLRKQPHFFKTERWFKRPRFNNKHKCGRLRHYGRIRLFPKKFA
ncbi:hypothetical protein [Haemophilus parainfluenzae]|uniref:hypothetical protein n=1 Tax=Haemophilus parainfluenzae TaxID=729 RepID=UPI0019554429|nr:hypothetical protein [Haemophilus parainfluenzae]